MAKTKKAQAEALLTMLRVNYGQQTIEPEKAAMLTTQLREMEYEVAAAVVARHMADSLYVPVEADLETLRRAVELELRDQDETLAEEAGISAMVKSIREDCWNLARLRSATSPDFPAAVRGHREQCVLNDRDAGEFEPWWRLRIEACDRILNSNPRATVETAV